MKKKEFGVLFGISVSLKITMAVILGLVSLIVIVLYCLVDSARAELTFAVGLLGGAAMIYAAYYAGISLRVAKYEGKQQRSFEILSSLNSIVMGKVRHLIEDEVFTKKIAPAELYQKILSDLDLLSGITALLGPRCPGCAERCAEKVCKRGWRYMSYRNGCSIPFFLLGSPYCGGSCIVSLLDRDQTVPH